MQDLSKLLISNIVHRVNHVSARIRGAHRIREIMLINTLHMIAFQPLDFWKVVNMDMMTCSAMNSPAFQIRYNKHRDNSLKYAD